MQQVTAGDSSDLEFVLDRLRQPLHGRSRLTRLRHQFNLSGPGDLMMLFVTVCVCVCVCVF